MSRSNRAEKSRIRSAQYYLDNKEQINADQRARYASDEEYRQRRKKAARSRQQDPECREATLRQRKEYRQNMSETQKEKHREASRDYMNRKTRAKTMEYFPVRDLYNRAKTRAKKYGIEFTIKIADIYIPDTCPIFGWPMYHGVGGVTGFSHSLDRIDSNQGYVPGNIQVICFRANTLKSNADLIELVALGNWAKSQLDGTVHIPPSLEQMGIIDFEGARMCDEEYRQAFLAQPIEGMKLLTEGQP